VPTVLTYSTIDDLAEVVDDYVGGLAGTAIRELLAVGVTVSALVALLLVSSRVSSRTLWRASALVVVAAILVWDGLEVRFDGSEVYWKSGWDWEDGGGGVIEWIAVSVLYVAPLSLLRLLTQPS
jgi:hypothetical protein